MNYHRLFHNQVNSSLKTAGKIEIFVYKIMQYLVIKMPA